MAVLQSSISYGCDINGSGYIQIDSISVVKQGTVTVLINGDTGVSYSPAFPPSLTPYRITNVPTATYTIETWQAGVKGTVKVNGATLSTAEIYIDCFTCDIVLNSVATTNANAPTANGTATITATGNKSPKQYSLNGSTWQTSNVFNGIAVGNYTAYVRYQNYTGCIASKAFTINPVPIYGCTNPNADNYNPAANTDNGTCVFIPQFFATGGTMPNPVWIEKTYSTTTGFPPKLKTRHYITLNIYNVGGSVPFATKIARVRNGAIKVDISKELQIGKLNLSLSNQSVSKDSNSSFPFEIGFIENYDGRAIAESRLPYPKRVAVRVALPKVNDSITPNVLMRKPNAEELQLGQFLSAFEVPVKFPEEPVCLSILIDETAYFNGSVYNALYLERSYFNVNKELVQRNSSEVYDTGFIRFEINDNILPCVSYMEVCLNTDFREKVGNCGTGEIVPPIIAPNVVQVRDGAGNVVADVPAGSAFVIQSGFSFGFGIVE
jgi:hypothetical protein